ncbi:MAG: HEAT repeat domain-containing protein [Anaerolineae bacterium]|nr:HEAT repeat domain-containing protein [Anaerolineae bacterium]
MFMLKRVILSFVVLVLLVSACAPNIARLAQQGDVEKLIEALSYEKDAAVRADAAAALAELDDNNAIEPLTGALADPEPTVRAAAIAALAQLQGSAAAREIVPMLKDDDAGVRQRAAEALTGLGRGAVSRLVDALNTTNNAYQAELAAVLAAIGEEAVEPLVEALGESSANTREGAQAALVLLDAATVPALIEALADADENLLAELSAALAAIGPGAIDPLAQALAAEDEQTAATAAALLTDLGAPAVDALVAALAEPQALERASDCLAAIGEPAVPALVQALGDAERTAAADLVLLKIGEPAIEPLIAVLADETLGAAAGNTLTGMGVKAIGPLVSAIEADPEMVPYAVQPLANALRFSDKNTRKKAAEALIGIGEAAVPYILEGIRTGSRILLADELLLYANPALYGTRGSAEGKLVDGGLCNDVGSWKGMIVLCQRGDAWFYEKVQNVQEGGGAGVIIYNSADEGLVVSLGEDHDTDLVTVSLSLAEGRALLKDHAGDVLTVVSDPLHAEQTDTLVAIGTAGLPHLVAALEDQLLYAPVEDVLIEIGSAAVPGLLDTAAEGKELVRTRAVYCLGQIGDDSAVPDLIGLLTDNSLDVQIEAAYALGNLRSAEAVEPLSVMLTDISPDVRDAARSSLAQIGLPAVPALLAAYADPDVPGSLEIAASLRDIFYANQTAVINAAAKVCQGEALPDAPKFSRYEDGPHPFVILNFSNAKHSWTDSIPVDWLPYSPADLQAVVCLEKTDYVTVQVCRYVYVSGGGFAGNITRYRTQLKSELYAASSGALVSGTTLRGSLPGYCPNTTSSYTDIYGSTVDYSDLKTWLKGLGLDVEK